jgi:hypothetical protein
MLESCRHVDKIQDTIAFQGADDIRGPLVPSSTILIARLVQAHENKPSESRETAHMFVAAKLPPLFGCRK